MSQIIRNRRVRTSRTKLFKKKRIFFFYLANRRKNIPWLSFFVFNCPFPGGLGLQLPPPFFSFLLLFIYLDTVSINRKPREVDPVVYTGKQKYISNLSQVHTAAFSLGSRKNWFIGYSLNEFFPRRGRHTCTTHVPQRTNYHLERTYLNVVLGDEPGPVSQNLIDFVEIPQFGRNRMESVEPALVSALQKELVHLLLNQVRTLMATSGLYK